jgi:hypothetical protein
MITYRGWMITLRDDWCRLCLRLASPEVKGPIPALFGRLVRYSHGVALQRFVVGGDAGC